ncbi:MAG TPA: hypothetical protein VFV38_24340 [Ktedonobacteraceae bacterium]|nr:hypothetical protein [Ktedonobacteraceae bacterium]
MSLLGKNRTDDQEDFPPYGDNFIPVIPVDYSVHTPENPFCDDMSCPCHEDADNQQALQNWYSEGLIGGSDGDLIYRGRTI